MVLRPFETDQMLLDTSLPVAKLARRVKHVYLSARAEKLSERKLPFIFIVRSIPAKTYV